MGATFVCGLLLRMLHASGKACAILLAFSMVDAFHAPALMPANGFGQSTKSRGSFRAHQTRRSGMLELKAYVPGQFEAQAPPLGPTLALFLSTVGPAAYWWLVLVPSERRDLAKNKNKGGLNEYLDELYFSDDGERKLEKWFYTEWLERRARVRKLTKKAKTDGELSSVATLTKEEEEEAEKAIEREIENAAPTPNFLSPDNPIIVGISLALLGVTFFGGR